MGKLVGAFFLTLLAFTKVNALELVCADKQNCNPSIVALEINYPENAPIDRCTGFLIAPDKVLTNGHCVIGKIGARGRTRQGQSCIGVSVHFFETEKYKKETSTCRRIDELTKYPVNEGINVPDYAILHIDKVARPGIKISKQQIFDNDQFQITKVNFKKDELGQVTATQVTDKNCQTDFASQAVYQPNSKTPIFMLKNCQVIAGNSGSLVANERGDAVGLVFRSFTMAGEKVLEGDKLGYYPFAATVMNLLCLDTHLNIEKDADLARACDATNYIYQSIKYNNTLGKELSRLVWEKKEISNKINHALKSTASVVEANYQQADAIGVKGTLYRTTFSAKPICVKKDSWFKNKLEFPQFFMSAFLDRNYRWEVFEIGQYKSSWKLKNVSTQGGGPIYTYELVQASAEFKIKTQEISLPACVEAK